MMVCPYLYHIVKSAGDIYPVTPYGRGFACLAACLGIIVIALPVTVLGTNFSVEYEKYTVRQTELKELRKKTKLRRKQQLAEARRASSHLHLSKIFGNRKGDPKNDDNHMDSVTVNALTQSMMGPGVAEMGIVSTKLNAGDSVSNRDSAVSENRTAFELIDVINKQPENIRFLLTAPPTTCSQADLLERYNALREAHERLLVGMETVKKAMHTLTSTN
jgi:hypothetical protein